MQSGRKRLILLAAVVTVGFVIILARAFYLAFGRGDGQDGAQGEILRGPIVDRRGFTLALTEEASAIGIAPGEVSDAEFVAETLARRLQMSPEEILQRIYVNKERSFFLLKRQVDDLAADQIVELHLPGVHRQREHRRVYPGGSLASNLLGFVGRDQEAALAGIERDYNLTLTAAARSGDTRAPTLRLTIDALVQHRLEIELAEAFERSGAKRAAGLIMNVQTGEILAMASMPNFDPNEYYKSNAYQRGNWNIRLNYEPGSTVKALMAGILLSERAVRPEERFFCPGEIKFYNSVVRCRAGGRMIAHGNLTLREIIQHSCNVGIIKAMQRIRPERLYRYLTQLDLGVKTGILPSGSGETSGYFPDYANWTPSTSYYMPIGQGFSVTPIQLLRAMSSLANGGRLVQPRLLSSISAPDGSMVERSEPESTSAPFSAEVGRAVIDMMRGVVRNGTGRAAAVPGLDVAGKTGTGEKSSSQGYLDTYVASFIGFFPANAPRFGALILFDEPRGQDSGGSLAAPVFARVIAQSREALEQADRVYSPGSLRPLPAHPPRINPDILYDLRGLSARDALNIISSYYRIPVEVHGSGYVYGQSPAPGVRIRGIQKIVLYLQELH
ncbi:MAG: transpeptidase family protein [Leptospirales bacterium]|nr:transpeptidase family protein [Leptospirales bacterium]